MEESQEPQGKGDTSIGAKAIKGSVATMMGQGSKILIQYGSLIVLARLLSPKEFGIVAMATVAIGLADVLRDFGLSSAAVQAEKLSPQQKTNLFWVNAAIGLALAILLWLGARWVALAYGDLGVAEVVKGLCWVFFINGIATQFRAHLNRNLKFSYLALVDVVAQLVGAATAISLAYMQYGWLSLVWSQICVAITSLLMMVIGGRWLPGWPRCREPMQGLLGFGGFMVLSQIVGYVGMNIDKYLVGANLGSADSGLYDRAGKLVNQPLTQLRAPTTTIAVPVLSRLQHDDRDYMRFLVIGQVGIGYSLVAFVAFVAAAAQPIVQIALGSAYTDSVHLVQAVSLAGGAYTISYVGYWVFVSRGLVRELSTWSTVMAVSRIAAAIIGLQFGVLGVAWGVALVPLITAPVSLLWLQRLTGLSFRKVVNGLLRVGGLAVVAAIVGYSLERLVVLSSSCELLAAVGGCLFTYLIAISTPLYRCDREIIVMLFKKVISRRTR